MFMSVLGRLIVFSCKLQPFARTLEKDTAFVGVTG